MYIILSIVLGLLTLVFIFSGLFIPFFKRRSILVDDLEISNHPGLLEDYLKPKPTMFFYIHERITIVDFPHTIDTWETKHLKVALFPVLKNVDSAIAKAQKEGFRIASRAETLFYCANDKHFNAENKLQIICSEKLIVSGVPYWIVFDINDSDKKEINLYNINSVALKNDFILAVK